MIKPVTESKRNVGSLAENRSNSLKMGYWFNLSGTSKEETSAKTAVKPTTSKILKKTFKATIKVNLTDSLRVKKTEKRRKKTC